MGRIKDLSNQDYFYAADDWLDKDGVTQASRKMTPFDAHGQFRNALDPRGGLAFNGTTNALAYSTLTNQNIGTDAFSLSCIIRMPTAIPAATVTLVGLGSNNATMAGVNNRFEVQLNTNGSLTLVIQDGTNTRTFVSNFVDTTIYGGKVVHIVGVRAAGVMTLYVNGVVHATTDQGDGGSITGSVTSTYLIFGYRSSTAVLNGRILQVSFYNLGLSQADVIELYENGGAVPDRFKFGSEVAAYVSNFSSTQDGWGGNNGDAGFVVTGNTTIASVSAACQFQNTESYALACQIKRSALPTISPRRFKIVFDYYASVGGGLSQLGIGFDTSRRDYGGVPVVEGSWQTGKSMYFDGTGDGTILFMGGFNGAGNRTVTNTLAAGASLYLKNVSLFQVGAVVHLPLDDGYSYHLRDLSTNALHGVISGTSIAHALDQHIPKHIRGTTNTNGNQQLQGVNLIPANSQITRIRARSETGTPTITIGTASGGSQLVASVALSTTWKDLMIALTGGIVTTDTAIWVGSGTTDVVDLDISCEPLSK